MKIQYIKHISVMDAKQEREEERKVKEDVKTEMIGANEPSGERR